MNCLKEILPAELVLNLDTILGYPKAALSEDGGFSRLLLCLLTLLLMEMGRSSGLRVGNRCWPATLILALDFVREKDSDFSLLFICYIRSNGVKNGSYSESCSCFDVSVLSLASSSLSLCFD